MEIGILTYYRDNRTDLKLINLRIANGSIRYEAR